MRALTFYFFATCAALFFAGQIRACQVDEDEEDLDPIQYESRNARKVVTYREIRDRASVPDEEVLKRVRIEWRGIDIDKTWHMLRVRGRLVVDDGGTVRPVDWFQGVSVRLPAGAVPPEGWPNGADRENTVQSDVLVRRDGTFTASFLLTDVPRTPSIKRECPAAVALGKPDGRRMIYEAGALPLAGSITLLTLPEAPKLDATLQLINAASPWPNRRTPPAALIKAVNALQALGKQPALDALRRYIEIAPEGLFHSGRPAFDPANIDQGDYNVAFWIIRLLFEPAQSGTRIRQPLLGAAVPSPGKGDERLWPLFPMELVDDVPFMIAHGWNLGGVPEHPSSHIEWAERYGVVRDMPLRPADDPLAVADRLLSLPKSQRLKLRDDPIRTQAWQLVADLFPTITPDPKNFDEIGPQQWTELRRLAAQRRLYWDEKRQAYTLADQRE